VFLTREELARSAATWGRTPSAARCSSIRRPTKSRASRKSGSSSPPPTTRGHNLVILIDAGIAKKKDSDYTAGWVIGLGPDRKVYVHDMIRDRLSLTERAALLMAGTASTSRWPWLRALRHDGRHRAHPRFAGARELPLRHHELGGTMAKVDRIRRLIPWFEQGRIYLHPKIEDRLRGAAHRPDQELHQRRIQGVPGGRHDDMLDALARFLDDDLPIRFPLHKVQVANGTDIIQGVIMALSDDAGNPVKGWEAGASDDTITLNRGTTGTAKVGHSISIEDIASGVFAVTGSIAQSGTEATPFLLSGLSG
jgi:phage terminase large subunit-like protein